MFTLSVVIIFYDKTSMHQQLVGRVVSDVQMGYTNWQWRNFSSRGGGGGCCSFKLYKLYLTTDKIHQHVI